MTILKRDSRTAVHAARFDGARAVATPVATTDPLAEEMAGLRAQLTARERELAAQAEAADAACAEAFARGRDEGRAEAAGDDQARLAALVEGVEAALTAFDAHLSGARDLAVDIAETALAAMLGTVIPYRALVAATAARHAAALSHGTIVRLRVSAADFPEAAALATLPVFERAVEVSADPALAAGTCRFDLTLGELDASIPVQAAAIAQLLDEARAA